METQTEKKEKRVSDLYLIEKGTWQKGKEVITFTHKPEGGKHRAIGHVFAEYDKDGNITFLSKDKEGNEILPPCHNRYDLKKQFLDNEQELVQRLENKPEHANTTATEKAQPATTSEQVLQPTENADREKQQTKTGRTRKGKELSDIRKEKGSEEKEQSNSR